MVPCVSIHLQAGARDLVVELLLAGRHTLVVKIGPWNDKLDERLAFVTGVPALGIGVERWAGVPVVAVGVGESTLVVTEKAACLGTYGSAAYFAVLVSVYKISVYAREDWRPTSSNSVDVHAVGINFSVYVDIVDDAALEGHFGSSAGKVDRARSSFCLILVDDLGLGMPAHHEIGHYEIVLEGCGDSQVAKCQSVGSGVEVGGRPGVVGNGVNIAVLSHGCAAEEGGELGGIDKNVVAGTPVHNDTAFEICVAPRLSFGVEEIVYGGEGVLVILILTGHGSLGVLPVTYESELQASSFQFGSPQRLFLAGERR